MFAASPAGAQPAAQPNHWRQMLEADLAFVRTTLEQKYIYAVYPGGAPWEALYGPASRQAGEAVATVTDFAGYRAVLTRFIGAFQDPHLRINLNMQPARYQWPGFTARYANRRLLVGTSDLPDVPVGAEIHACDARPAIAMLDALAPLEGAVAGIESSRSQMAARLFTDAQNPFFARPAQCRIGESDVTLSWSQVRAEQLLARTPPPVVRDVPVGLSDFGSNGAWIRLPAMSPRGPAETAAYRAVIAEAAGLRDRPVIVFDVRGNGGGPYNWFMAILRALYGDEAARYHARERLRIRPIFVAGTLNMPPPGAARPADPNAMPPDVELDATLGEVRQIRLESGREVTAIEHASPQAALRPAGPPPANPVRGQVYVLTDHGCGSACISFVDEMLQFPGVRQIGLETFVDMRSGSPANYNLPSGNGVLNASTMVRENRARGENVQHVPSRRYAGDITDTAAVRRWIVEELLPSDRNAR